MSKSIIRSIKNVTNGYTVNQVKVRNVTSNDAWGPSSRDMDEIAQLTFDPMAFTEIMDMLERRLNDKGKNWRHVMKALVLLDYCIHVGSEDVVRWAKDNIFVINTLNEFQHIDEEGKDQGQNVRIKAKDLAGLLLDDERIRAERVNRSQMRAKLNRAGDHVFSNSEGNLDTFGRVPRRRTPIQSDFQNDEEFQLALEESKFTAAEEDARRRERETAPDDDEDMQRAIKLSAEEALKSQQQEYYDIQNNSLLFADNTQQPASPQYHQSIGFNQSFRNNPYSSGHEQPVNANTNNSALLVDIFGSRSSAGQGAQPSTQNPYAQQLFSQSTSQQQYSSLLPLSASAQSPQQTPSYFGNNSNAANQISQSASSLLPFSTSRNNQQQLLNYQHLQSAEQFQKQPLQSQPTEYQLFQRPIQTQSASSNSPFAPTVQNTMTASDRENAYSSSSFETRSTAGALSTDWYDPQRSYDSVGWMSGANPLPAPASSKQSNNPFSKPANGNSSVLSKSNDMSLL
ncbi:hypothetical protein V1512DRAFT_255402 [Lipomyces arxii]|uniref:uncharacterized protein n=1 Tax=Lipomyces arxii TaxID=56418 RepID=UPI0034CEFCC2